MLDEKQVNQLAQEWLESWNSHNIDRIISHYEDDVELTSPVVTQLLGDVSGTVRGKENLKAYFLKGLAAYPDLKFEPIEVLSGINSIVIYYLNQRGTHTAEYMEITRSRKIARVVANYSQVTRK
ncbi:MAG: nuclear transport factor 2 family protein [Oscillatoria sp. PMC 1051.18]|uniref:nuclear transport factor 2 family protein n=1 Tax=Oscillatoria salina TaxID=331517 RepID=UPI0013B772BB|nr:nuclear transport factor 2 family protein [Oscillatoria salina]MBZ8180207.1 nuclear transport factor 2 family protein [Oscillatoria salina IIICB1]MEC4891558.1 nuclear transport factor 2 family protein [Oscillatoria sp. PMC 1050.18]MEC5029658.1 nuclear transport factor 2 family protein [Oscillatoria sp. PMC 1051.18]NET91239.1 nuclear transport factor 2 family protein [Kamptonema sp. SIO1D9]